MSKKLTKAEIVENIFQKLNTKKILIIRTVDLVFEELKKALIQDKIIELRGFGTFEIKTRKGKLARNPKTGAKVKVENHGVVIFRAGRDLKKDVWNLRE